MHGWVLALLMLLTLPVLAQRNLGVAQAERGAARVALVIGNAKYPSAPLRNAVNDARDMAAALRHLGFDVIERTNATQKEMNRAIAQFGNKIRSDSIALFYYAGHGMQVKGKNFLIPVDAQIDSESSVRVETVDVDGALDQLSISSLNIVILDACRNNPFERRFRGTSGGLAQMDAPKGSLIAYATAPGKTAADGEGRNGIYTQELLKLMQTPGIPIEQVFKRVRANVARATADNQIPWEASSLTGDFYFNAEAPASAGPASLVGETTPPPAMKFPEAAAIELAYWESIKDSKDVADFNAYLEKYPEGQFVALAKNRMAAASRATRKDAAPDIAGLWHWSVKTIFVPDRTNTIKADGTCELNTGTTCVWSYLDPATRKIAFRFSDTWTHTMKLAEDGRSMTGADDWGTTVVATKAGAL
ncbi:MAG: hypothetical protein A3H93_17255 [Rhodocyclales bacterium RIFCSPLOWO2_02_FULL_63_24]|nr:MAG: hypothetical protein A3H93_17255 [Rhodocyclales bacterium RIFCSPLOWO2_02_FULL_63_24]